MNTKKDKQKIEDKARAYLLNGGLTPKQIAALEKIGYFTAPASMRHHLNVPGGLIEHSINVTDYTLGLGVFKERASAFRFGMLHDLVKCYNYRKAKTGTGYTFALLQYPGHGVASALIASDLGISLTDEERCAIVWHMGAFRLDEEELKAYHAALALYPRTLILSHAADHLASAIED